MPNIERLFATQLFRGTLRGRGAKALNGDLERACRAIAAEDRAGRAWCRANAYPGYTSYASLDDLVTRAPEFEALTNRLAGPVAAFSRVLDLDLGHRKLALDSIWINVLASGGAHPSHIHPHAVISGTYYVTTPPGTSAIRFEDPRLGLMMAAPPRKPRARRENRTFVSFEPTPGTVLLWESWLRHEVALNRSRSERISISFNYAWR